jgi:hypothetical protein
MIAGELIGKDFAGSDRGLDRCYPRISLEELKKKSQKYQPGHRFSWQRYEPCTSGIQVHSIIVTSACSIWKLQLLLEVSTNDGIVTCLKYATGK